MNETSRRRIRGMFRVSLVVAWMAFYYVFLVAVVLAAFGYVIVYSGHGTVSEAVWMPVPGSTDWAFAMHMGIPLWLLVPALGMVSIFAYGMVRRSRREPSKVATQDLHCEEVAKVEIESSDSANKLLKVLDLIILSCAASLIWGLMNIAMIIAIFGSLFVATGHVTISEVAWMPLPGTAGWIFGELGLPLWFVLIAASVVPIGIYGRIRAKAKGERFITMAEGNREARAEKRAALRRLYADEVSAP